MKIAAFDSGIGGTYIFEEIKRRFPEHEYLYLADSEHCPYGEKSDSLLRRIVKDNVTLLQNWGADIVIIACNTASVRCGEYLSRTFPNITFVRTEPSVRLAATSPARHILVMATPGTIRSERLHGLIAPIKNPKKTIELLACPGLADAIEHTLGPKILQNSTDTLAKSSKILQNSADSLIENPKILQKSTDNIAGNPKTFQNSTDNLAKNPKIPPKNTDSPEIVLKTLLKSLKSSPDSYDAVVLGCTHYPHILPELKKYFKNATFFDGTPEVIEKLTQKIADHQKP